MEKLTKKELLKLIKAYNDYVMTFYEEHDESCFPICIYEFFDNEYQIERGLLK